MSSAGKPPIANPSERSPQTLADAYKNVRPSRPRGPLKALPSSSQFANRLTGQSSQLTDADRPVLELVDRLASLNIDNKIFRFLNEIQERPAEIEQSLRSMEQAQQLGLISTSNRDEGKAAYKFCVQKPDTIFWGINEAQRRTGQQSANAGEQFAARFNQAHPQGLFDDAKRCVDAERINQADPATFDRVIDHLNKHPRDADQILDLFSRAAMVGLLSNPGKASTLRSLIPNPDTLRFLVEGQEGVRR